MPDLTQKRQLTNLDKAGAYFQKTLGVLPELRQKDREAAIKYVARNAHSKAEFTDIVDSLGLDDIVNEKVGEGWR